MILERENGGWRERDVRNIDSCLSHMHPDRRWNTQRSGAGMMLQPTKLPGQGACFYFNIKILLNVILKLKYLKVNIDH